MQIRRGKVWGGGFVRGGCKINARRSRDFQNTNFSGPCCRQQGWVALQSLLPEDTKCNGVSANPLIKASPGRADSRHGSVMAVWSWGASRWRVVALGV